MSWNGSGVYSLPGSPTFPAVSGAVVSSAYWNATFNDVATAMNNALCKDGQNAMTADLNLNGFRLKSLHAGSTTTASLYPTGDPNTGLYFPAADQADILTGGVSAFHGTATAATLPGTLAISGALTGVTSLSVTTLTATNVNNATGVNIQYNGATKIASTSAGSTLSGTVTVGTLDNGSTAINVTSTNATTVMNITNTTNTENEGIFTLNYGSVGIFAKFFAGATTTWGAGNTVMQIAKNSGTSRSISAAGTLNASGADYAEYMTKAIGCGNIQKGQVCGVDKEGHLTDKWTDAVSFVVKSTDPAYVGGDAWANDIKDPIPPDMTLTDPGDNGPSPLAMMDDGTAHMEFLSAKAAFDSEAAAFPALMSTYEQEKSAFDLELETRRQKVDRIAFSGQVPCIVTGAFNPGDYIIATQGANGDIIATAVGASAMTLEMYFNRIGKVWAVRNSLAWIDVQHG